METINDLRNQISNGRNKFLSATIKCESIGVLLSKSHFSGIKNIEFNDCTFIGSYLEISGIDNPNLGFRFLDCSFEISLKIEDCKLQTLGFARTKKIKSIKIWNCKSDFFYFKNDKTDKSKNELSGDVSISNLEVFGSFEYKNINHIKGKFSFSDSTNISINVSDVNDFINFENNTFDTANFYNVTFINKVSFNKTEIINNCNFDKCDFLETTWFEKCLKNKTSKLKFIACKFKKYSLFDNSFFNEFEISHTKFEEKASFENFNTNLFKIHQVSFLGQAYFNELNNKNHNAIKNWDRKTLNSIKRELANSHNQIDYLRFKAYELEAFKLEDNLWKDKFILHLNSYSSKNGLDWFRGFLFTIIISVCFFYLYSIVEVYNFFTNPIDYNFISTERVKEYFYFLNPSDFDYHFDKLKENKTNICATIVFIFAKIFIGYGIYQTIQAFRKFGVNGG